MAKKKNPCKFILLKTGEELNYDQARDFLFKNYDFNTKTLKSESYAVQVEEPSGVPVQPKAGISGEMAEGAPKAKPEVTAEKEEKRKQEELKKSALSQGEDVENLIHVEDVFKNKYEPKNYPSPFSKQGKDLIDKNKAKIIEESINVEDIVPTQVSLEKDNIGELKDENAKLPILIKEGNKFYVLDGHHRIATEIQNGKTTIKARVFPAEKGKVEEEVGSFRDVELSLRYPKKNEVVFVSTDAILEKHAKDQPDFDIQKKENQIGNRVDKAKDFILKYLKDPRSINPRTGERMKSKVTFEPSVAQITDDGKLSFEDGRHRILAAKELGIKEVPIEVPKNQVEIFKEQLSKKPITPTEYEKPESKRRPESSGDRGRREESGRFAPLEGAPSVPGINGPDPQLVAVAEQYARDNGIDLKRQGEYVRINVNRAKRIADAYEKMKHDPNNPKVKEAYQNLIKQTIAQYEALVKAGYKFWFMDTNIPGNVEYADSPYNALRDLRQNKQMGVFPTTDGYGTGDFDSSDNPLLIETKYKWPVGGLDGELKPVLANDLFRAVHDAFGHGLEGAGFRSRGEENAWQAHIRLFTGSAKGAITSETRGQNSWLNYGPHGEKNRTAKTEETIFSDQKIGLMPEWTWKEGIAPDFKEKITPTEYEIKKEDVQPMLEGVRGIRPEEKGREVSPGVRAEEEAKREEEVKIEESKKEEIELEIREAKENLKNILKGMGNIGFAYDPKKEAEKQYNLHKALVSLAKAYIKSGINTVQDFATKVKLSVADVQRAWEEAFSGKELSESKLRKELENNPYDVQAISQALMTPEQAAAKSPLQIEADDAVKNNQVYSFEDFDAMMKANTNYKSLSSADKKNLYDNAVMEFNTNVVITLEQETPTIFNPEGWFTKFIRKWFDPKIRLKNVQEQLKQNDIEVLKEANAYLAYELLNGQSASKIEDFENEIIKSKSKAEPSLIERMIKDKADPDMVGLFMYAQHAKERNDAVAAERQELYTKKVDELNAQISAESDPVKKQRLKDKLAKIVEGKDPDYKLMPDGGSGMTNKQAEEILQSFEQAGTYDLYEKYANEWREKVTKRALQMRLDYGLISDDTFKDLTTKFQYYVPLNVVEKTKGKSATKTPGHGVRGRDIFRAKGSNLYSFTERYNPIVSSSFHFKNVIIRGEENKAAQALLELAKLDKNNELFEIIKPRTRIVYDSNGEEIVIPIDQIPSDAFALKDKGKQVYIRLKDPGLRDEINKQGVMRGIRGLFIINNWIRNTSLLLNPEFMLSNSIKDFQTALVNIQSVKKDLDVKGITRDLLNPKNIKGAMKGVYADINGDYKSDWAKWAKEYRDAGGKVSWFAPETMDESLVSLNKQIEKLQKGENVFEKAFNLYVGSFFKMQSSVEQYIRLSAYKALRDKGVSKEEAASAAKNLTVNFERRGTVMGLVDSLYLFTGAKLGAIYRLTASMKKSKASRAILGSLVAYGFLESLMNYYLGGDDEEDRKIEEGMKERSLIFLNPTDPANNLPYRFPIQYGLNVFKYAGNIAFDVSVGRKSVFEGSKLLMTSVWNNVLPFEGPTAGQAFAPTAFDPIVQAYENKNFFGGDIVPKQPLRKEARKKESELYFKTARPLSVKIAKKIDEITGGTELTEGQISISPEILDHTYDSFAGGVGRFAANLVETGVSVGSKVLGDKDAEMSAEKIPFVRLFVGGKKDENFQNVFDIVSESSVKKIDDKDLKYFNSNLNDLLKRGSIDKDQYKNYKENVEKNQFKINEESTLVNYLKKFENYLSENGYEPLDNKTKAKVINEIGTYMYNNYKMGNDIKQINLLPALSRNTEYVKKKK